MTIKDQQQPVSAGIDELLKPERYEEYRESLKKTKKILSKEAPFSLPSEDMKTITEKLLGTLGCMIRTKKLLTQKLEERQSEKAGDFGETTLKNV